jgi:hypothetical protein
MENILFISSIPTQFRALLPLSQVLKASGKYNPVFFFDTSRWPVSHEIETCRQLKIDFLIDRVDYPLSSFQKQYSRMILKLNRLSSIFKYLSYYTDNIALATKVLRDKKVKYLFLPGDANFNYISPFFVKTANRLHIPSAVFPFSLCNQEETVCRFKNTKDYDVNTFSKRFWTTLLPKWKYNANGRLMLRKSVPEMLAIQIIGCSPVNPWMYIGGDATRIFVECEFVKDYYIASGVDKNKIEIIGNIGQSKSSDQPVNTQVDADGKKIVVCSLPPDLEDTNTFATHREMTEFWIKSLNRPEIKLIISLHPRLALKDFKFITDDYGIEISGRPVNDLIKDCDIFVAGASATIRTALAYKKITLNFDTFFSFTTFFNIPMVIYVQTKEEFLKEYDKLIRDNSYYDKLKMHFNDYPEQYFGYENMNYVNDLFSRLPSSV